jgi:hypothetical protein
LASRPSAVSSPLAPRSSAERSTHEEETIVPPLVGQSVPVSGKGEHRWAR